MADKALTPHAHLLEGLMQALIDASWSDDSTLEPRQRVELMVRLCRQSIAEGKPCARGDIPDYAAVAFLRQAPFSVLARETLSTLFTEYVAAGHIQLDRPMRSTQEGLYARFHGKRMLQVAVELVNRPMIELLLQAGADSDFLIEGVPLVEWSAVHAGEYNGKLENDELRLQFSRELLAQIMQQHIQLHASSDAARSPTPRRGRAL